MECPNTSFQDNIVVDMVLPLLHQLSTLWNTIELHIRQKTAIFFKRHLWSELQQKMNPLLLQVLVYALYVLLHIHKVGRQKFNHLQSFIFEHRTIPSHVFHTDTGSPVNCLLQIYLIRAFQADSFLHPKKLALWKIDLKGSIISIFALHSYLFYRKYKEQIAKL